MTLYPPDVDPLILPLPFTAKPLSEEMNTHERNQILDHNFALEQEEGLFSFISIFSFPVPPFQVPGSSKLLPIEISDSSMDEDDSP
jgi:hypothetical protein